MSTQPIQPWRRDVVARPATEHELAELAEPIQELRELLSSIEVAVAAGSDDSAALTMFVLGQVSRMERSLSTWQRTLAVSASEFGISYRGVASSSGVTHQTVRNWVEKAQSG